MTPLHETPTCRLYHCKAIALADRLRAAGEQVDALIVDAPYSERTHAGHRVDAQDSSNRRGIDYEKWTPRDVTEFCSAWTLLASGWCVAITDYTLAPHWYAALEAAGRYVFAPLAIYEPGSRVRLTGDGPSSWTTWMVVARPKTRAFRHWGTLPGGYTPRQENKPIVGGKAINLMRSIVRDYSRPGDLVCDPCCGAGSTLIAALAEGRRAIGCDRDEAHAEMARRQLLGLPAVSDGAQRDLFGGGT